jgi:hypothetical protein
VAEWKYNPGSYLEGHTETKITPVRIVGVPTEVGTQDIENTDLKHYRFANLLSGAVVALSLFNLLILFLSESGTVQ